MIIGIVGAEAAKFTSKTEEDAKDIIRVLLTQDGVTGVCSGHCHLGGIDIWAEEIGDELGLTPYIFAPANRTWSDGFQPRNIKIAETSHEVHCITVRVLPVGYIGMRFPLCYHCKSTDHVKSGGCWTAKYAQRLGKHAEWWTV